MRKVLFSTLAVLMTATTNFVFAQSNNVEIVQSKDTQVLEITYVSDKPHKIGFELVGGIYFSVEAFARIANVSNGDGTCTASYDLQKLKDSPSGGVFTTEFELRDEMRIYKDPRGSNREFLFSALASDYKQ